MMIASVEVFPRSPIVISVIVPLVETTMTYCWGTCFLGGMTQTSVPDASHL